jgi:hypothetical protein
MLATQIGLQRIEEKLEKSSNTEQGIKGSKEKKSSIGREIAISD